MLELDREQDEEALDPDAPEPLMSDEEFDAEVEQAAAGNWEALGLEGPDSAPEKFETVTTEQFLKE